MSCPGSFGPLRRGSARAVLGSVHTIQLGLAEQVGAVRYHFPHEIEQPATRHWLLIPPGAPHDRGEGVTATTLCPHQAFVRIQFQRYCLCCHACIMHERGELVNAEGGKARSLPRSPRTLCWNRSPVYAVNRQFLALLCRRPEKDACSRCVRRQASEAAFSECGTV